MGGQPVLSDRSRAPDLDIQEPRERLRLPVLASLRPRVVHHPGDHPILVGPAMTPHVLVEAQGFHAGLVADLLEALLEGSLDCLPQGAPPHLEVPGQGGDDNVSGEKLVHSPGDGSGREVLGRGGANCVSSPHETWGQECCLHRQVRLDHTRRTGTPKTPMSWRRRCWRPSATAWTPQAGQNTMPGSVSTFRRRPAGERSTRVTWKPGRSAMASASVQ